MKDSENTLVQWFNEKR